MVASAMKGDKSASDATCLPYNALLCYGADGTLALLGNRSISL